MKLQSFANKSSKLHITSCFKNITKRKDNITRHFTERWKNITLSIIIIMLCFLNIIFLGGGIYGSNITNSSVSALSYSATSDVSFTFAPKLSISMSDTNLVIDNLVPGQTSTSNAITITVASNTPYGYSLYADAGSNNTSSPYYNTSSLIHEDNTINNTFTSIATNASLTSLTTDNTWGYSTSTDNGTTWSAYNGLLPTTSTDSSTSTSNPSLLIDTKDPADSSKSIAFKVAARASTTQASGTYGNIINFYAVGKPEPKYLYDEVAKMSKGTQDATDLQATITSPTSTDYRGDTSNSGVYEYNSAVFGESSDASNANKIYYYRGILEPEVDQGSYGSDGQATTYPNYVKLANNTCWRIVRTTGSGGVKMIYNGVWDMNNGTCANSGANTSTNFITYAHRATSSSKNYWESNIHYVGYTYNNNMTDKTTSYNVDTAFGSNSNYSVNSTDSNIKNYLENTWYVSNMLLYANILESSAGYCNDRTLYSTINYPYTRIYETIPFLGPTSGSSVIFGRTARGSTPSLTCPRKNADLYTAHDAQNGNKQLAYPAALLTGDEASLAMGNSSSKIYLKSGSDFWLLTPRGRYTTSSNRASVEYVSSTGSIIGQMISKSKGVRPVISLKPGITATSGSGTATNPWVVPAP